VTTARHEAIAIGLWRVRLDQTRTRCNFTRTRFSLATVLQDNVDPPGRDIADAAPCSERLDGLMTRRFAAAR
jgi:hypothetical protein